MEEFRFTMRDATDGYDISIRFNDLDAGKQAIASLSNMLGMTVANVAPAEQKKTKDIGPDDYKGLGDRIRDFRAEHGLTQRDVGKLLGCTGGAVNAWEHGVTLPNSKNIKRLIALMEPAERGDLAYGKPDGERAEETLGDGWEGTEIP